MVSYLVIFMLGLFYYTLSLKIETSSVLVRVPARNRWHTQISIISGKFNKKTIYKGVEKPRWIEGEVTWGYYHPYAQKDEEREQIPEKEKCYIKSDPLRGAVTFS